MNTQLAVKVLLMAIPAVIPVSPEMRLRMNRLLISSLDAPNVATKEVIDTYRMAVSCGLTSPSAVARLCSYIIERGENEDVRAIREMLEAFESGISDHNPGDYLLP